MPFKKDAWQIFSKESESVEILKDNNLQKARFRVKDRVGQYQFDC